MAGLAALYRAGFGARSQTSGPFPFRGETDEPVVALTFDDGPNEPWTSRLLDLLGEREVPATFFQVGRCAERHPDVTRRVVAEGHVLGNHSLSHAFGRYLSQPRQTAEIRGGQQVLHAVAGVSPLLYRPPWLCHWPWVLRSVARSGSSVVSGTFGSLLEVAQPSPKSGLTTTSTPLRSTVSCTASAAPPSATTTWGRPAARAVASVASSSVAPR